MIGSHTTPVAYDVVVDGSLLPGHTAEAAVAALVRRFGLPESDARDLLRGGREVVKQGLDPAKSETYVAALRRCGVVARAERTASTPPASHGGGDAPLAVDYAAAYVPPTPAAARPAPPRRPAPRVEPVQPAPRGSSLTIVGWSFLIALPLALLLFAFGDSLGRLAMFVAVGALIGAVICNFWMLSVIWEHGGALWAIAAFFFWPASLMFLIGRWDVARAPFLVGLAASLVWLSGITAFANIGAIECGSPGSFSYDDGDGCVCEDGYDWCGEGENDMSCCRM